MSKRKFDCTGYPCEVTDLSEDVWFYVRKEGIVICGRSRNGNPVEQAILPWRLVKRAMTDREMAKGRRPPRPDRKQP